MNTDTHKTLDGIENNISSTSQNEQAVEVIDESDEERELTNLNWLLRNQNLTWPKTINTYLEDENQTINQSSTVELTDCQKRTNQLKKHKQFENNTPNNMTNTKYLKSNLVIFPESKSTTASAHSKRLSPSERYDIFINKIKRDLAEYEKLATKYKTDVTEKPPFNYSHIIGMAMLDNGRATLQQICTWIESKFAFFRVRKKWNNSIRHNLSLHHCFRNRKREDKGKGGYWELGVDPKKCERKRIRNRKQITQTAKRENLCNNDINQICCQSRKSEYGIVTESNNILLESIKEQSINVTEVSRDISLDLSIPNVLNSRVRDQDATFLYSDDLTMSLAANMQPQYELGTIIISTTTEIIDEPTSCLSSIMTSKYGCANMVFTEANIPPLNDNDIVISSTHKMDFSKDENIPLVNSFDNSTAINCDYSNFRPYINDVDESFNYINECNEINQNEDLLDNLLDVCVRDF